MALLTFLFTRFTRSSFCPTANPCGTTARQHFGLISTVQPCAVCRDRFSSHCTATGTRELTRCPARNCFIRTSKLCLLPPDTVAPQSVRQFSNSVQGSIRLGLSVDRVSNRHVGGNEKY